MSLCGYGQVPKDLPGGMFIYRATESEELCFVDKNVVEIFGCESEDEFRALTGNSFRGMVHPDDLERV